MTLKDFIAHPSTGMRAYTRRLQEAVGQQGTTLSEQQLLEVAASVGLPQYIFSGVQQVCEYWTSLIRSFLNLVHG